MTWNGKKEKTKFFIGIAHIKSEICGISKKQIFNTKKNLLQLETYNFVKNETPTQVFPWEFLWEIFSACNFFENVTLARVNLVDFLRTLIS